MSKYEVVLRESSITPNNHLKPFEVVEADWYNIADHVVEFLLCQYDETFPIAAYNLADVIRITKLS